ncbi:MAG: copper-translocating P-type ATPase [Trueperaceae bacterium]
MNDQNDRTRNGSDAADETQGRLRDRVEHARPLETRDEEREHDNHAHRDGEHVRTADGHAHDHDRPGHGSHVDHDKHAGHSPAMFRDRFWLSLLLALPILYFDPHFQEWFGYRAVQLPGDSWIQPLLGIALFIYGGGVFMQGAWRELRARQPGMMTLIGLAISVAFAYSLAVSLGLAGMALYWELATLILVMLLGHWIELASVQGAGRALEHLASLVPSTAWRLTGNRTEEVPVGLLKLGDAILVRPGEQIPADGHVTDGASSVNEAFLTGESKPLSKREGDEVVAGSVNGEGALTVAVSRVGEQTTLSQIQRLVGEAQESRSRFQGLADRAAAWLTYIAVGAGAVTLLVWLLAGFGFDFALTRTVTVLVMACPHALGLAIPLVMVNATAMSARNGILVRNREAFERAKDLRIVAFDKTGTLTEGKFGVRGVYTSRVSEEEALRLAATLEARSEHPLALAVVEEAGRRGLEPQTVADFTVSAGKGVAGTIAGTSYRIGSPEWASELQLEMPGTLQEGLEEAEARGESVIALSDPERVLALFALADKIRASAREAIEKLRDLKIESVMITGDAEAVAATVARELGIERYHARVLPSQKAELIASLRREGGVAFVGDGINDAPALLEANLGVAIGAGTNVAIESADLVLIENDPLDVVRALRLSRATYGKMIQNLFWATGYNAVALPLAAGVAYAWGLVLSPAAGAVFMSASTVIVAVNAMLLRRARLN